MDDYKIDGQIVCLTSPEFALSYKWYPEAKSFKDNPKIQFISAQSIDKYRNNGYEFDKDIVEGKVLAAHPFKPKTFIEFDTAEHHIYSEKVNAMCELAYRLGAKSIEQKFVLEDIEQLKIDSSGNLSYAKINIDAKVKREEAQKKTSKYHKKQTFEGNYNKDSWEKAKLTAKKYGLDKDAEINNLIITRNPDESLMLKSETVTIEMYRELKSIKELVASINGLRGVAGFNANFSSDFLKIQKYTLESTIIF